MYNPNYLKAILIYVKDKETGYIHIVGTDQHDRLYLDDDGHIQYFNLQNGCGTPDEYDFVLDPEGHDQNNLPFTEEEQIMYGLSNMDAYFGGVDLKKAQSLTERAEKTKEETNFEHFFEYLSKLNMSDFALIDGRVTQCLGTICSKCDFNGDCIERKFKWLKQPYKKQTYKLTKFEFDLIQTYRDCHESCKLSEFKQLIELKDKGYFKCVDLDTKIQDVLKNCEVIQ